MTVSTADSKRSHACGSSSFFGAGLFCALIDNISVFDVRKAALNDRSGAAFQCRRKSVMLFGPTHLFPIARLLTTRNIDSVAGDFVARTASVRWGMLICAL